VVTRVEYSSISKKAHTVSIPLAKPIFSKEIEKLSSHGRLSTICTWRRSIAELGILELEGKC
jgi:hypothetical protein